MSHTAWANKQLPKWTQRLHNKREFLPSILSLCYHVAGEAMDPRREPTAATNFLLTVAVTSCFKFLPLLFTHIHTKQVAIKTLLSPRKTTYF